MLGFFHQAVVEHLASPLIDALVERGAVRIEADSQNAKALQRVAPLLPQFGHSLARPTLPRLQTDFDGANELWRIVGMNLVRRFVIEMAQNPVQIIRAELGYTLPQTLPQFFRSLGPGEESFQQRSQIESGPAHNDRQTPA